MKTNKKSNLLFFRGNYLRLSLILLMSFLFNNMNAQQNIVSGKVVDNSGIPLPGVNIVIKGTNKSSQTDFDGKFSIAASPGNTIIFTYIGMDANSVLVGDKTNINVTLKPSSQSLEQVVVIGYGTKKKSDVISSVASVKSEDLIKVPTSDVGEMLRGKAAGVQVTLANGGPGSSSSIQIRGKKSINGSNDPIVIVDGVVVGNINDVNPNDIASLEVLKDAASQSIYGARAANGVILITTKRGKLGKVSVSYNGFSGVQTINRNFDIYSGEEYAQLKREAERTSNGGVYKTDAQIFSGLELASVQSGKYIDWEKYILRTGTTNNHNLSVSSGTENTNIFSSFNYINITGVIPNSDYQKFSTRLNVDQRINKWLKLGVNLSIQFSESNDPNDGGILLNSITTTPLGEVYNPDGTFRYLPGGFAENKNPLIDIYETNTNGHNRNDLINAFINVTPFKGFAYKFNASRRSWNEKEMVYNSTKSLSGIANSGQANGSISFRDNVEYQIENIFTYSFNLAEKNHFGITAVQSTTSSEYNEFRNTASQIPNDILGIYGLESAAINTPTIAGSERALVSFAGRVEYDFDNKYYLGGSVRADGSSLFGKNNKWGYFPSVSAGWNVHKENFMIEHVPVVSNLKLRVSYGKVGNQPSTPYQSIASASQRDYYINDIKVSGFIPGTDLSNPDLKWETSKQLNTAVDLGLFKNRIQATVEYYNTRTTDLLIYQALNANTGYTRKLSNIGEVENQGIEASLNTAIIKKEDFKLNLGFTFTKNKNKIISIYGKDANGDGKEDDDLGNSWFIGQPIDVYYQYKAAGIFQQGETSAAQPLAQPGDVKLVDVDPTDGAAMNPAKDRFITSKMPKWYGSASISMQYKNFDFSADFYTVQGIIKNNPFLTSYNEGGSLRGIKNGIKQDYWTPENTTGNFPRPRAANDPDNITYLGLQDASYFRLQNLSLGFTFPDSVKKSIGAANMRLYLTGSNLFTITHYQSYSPEKNPNDYPEPVTVVTGLQVSF